MNTQLSTIVRNSLPLVSGKGLTYLEDRNMFVTDGYTSAAGNTYHNAIRLSKRLIVYYDLGIGYYYTFLNGITLYGFDGKKARIVAKENWGGCGNWIVFTEETAKKKCIVLLKKFLQGEAKKAGAIVSESELGRMADELVSETYRKMIA